MRKKAIGPIIALALLIVVSVVAVIGFQNWFGMYSTQIFTDAELKSEISNFENNIQTVVKGQLYIRSNPGENLTIKKIIIDSFDCNISRNVSGVQNISLENCINNVSTSTPEVVVVTENEVITKQIYLEEVSTTFSSVSTPFNPPIIKYYNVSVTKLIGAIDIYNNEIYVDDNVLNNITVKKLDLNFNELSSNSIDLPGLIEKCFDSKVDNLGNMVLFSSLVNSNDYLVKLNNSLNELWSISLGNIGDKECNIEIFSNNDILTACSSGIRKYNSSGNLVWVKSYGSFDVTDIVIDSSDNIFVSGEESNNNYFFTGRLNSTGDFLWNTTINQIGEGKGVIVDNENNIISAGTLSGNLNIFKYDQNGNHISNTTSSVNTLLKKMIFANNNYILGGKTNDATNILFFDKNLNFLGNVSNYIFEGEFNGDNIKSLNYHGSTLYVSLDSPGAG